MRVRRLPGRSRTVAGALVAAGLHLAMGGAAGQTGPTPRRVGVDAPGVTPTHILIGLEGATQSFSSDEENLGMRLVMQVVNDRGGIHGRRLEARGYARSGGAAADEAFANVRREVEDDTVFLVFNHGGPAALAIAPYAMAKRVPYLFPHTALLTAEADRYVFTSYPRYEGESAVVFRHLARTLDIRRIGILHDENVYGRYFKRRLAELADTLGYAVTGAEGLTERKPTDLAPQLEALRAGGAEAVILALYPEQARSAMEAKRRLGWNVRMVSTGPLTDEQYLVVDGGTADGTIGFCHYPDPTEDRSPGVLEYRTLMAKYYPGHPVNRYSLYGYVFGRLVVEGLERAGRELSRERFIDAMESIREWESGGILPPVSFSPQNHHAQRAGFICELRSGRFRAQTGWLEP